jgi:hypothetical protein
MQGVIAGMVYNNLRPLDMAANKETVSRYHKIYDNFPLHAGCNCRDGVQQPATPGHGRQQGDGDQDQGLAQPPYQAGARQTVIRSLKNHIGTSKLLSLCTV